MRETANKEANKQHREFERGHEGTKAGHEGTGRVGHEGTRAGHVAGTDTLQERTKYRQTPA
jgi:hypothetical protein